MLRSWLSSLLQGNAYEFQIETMVVQLVCTFFLLFFCLPIHEFAHAWMATRCGDNTAKNMGRLTLNPLKHLDPLGTLMLLLAGFGYAKPVPIVPRNFRKFKRDRILVAVAGPLANFALATLGILLFNLTTLLPIEIQHKTILWLFLTLFVRYNIGLMLFNLIPLPPLDGSHILDSLLPTRAQVFLDQNARALQGALMLLLVFNILTPVLGFLGDGVFWVLELLITKPFQFIAEALGFSV